MGKFTKFSTVVEPKKRPWKIHPIWRGIGCVIIILIPIISYAGSVLLVDANLKNRWLPIPREFIGPAGMEMLYIQIGVTILLILSGYIFIVFLYSILYRSLGPPQKGPLDAPPVRRRRVNSRSKRK